MENLSAEIITIGDEILLGQILNTNTHWLATELTLNGYQCNYQTTIGDAESHILTALETAVSRASIVLITGGLGPTKDDVTKYTLAKFFESDLAINETALAELKDLMERRGRTLNELNRLQALQPTKAEYVRNSIGTAPGMWFNYGNDGKKSVVVSMPGVPAEMKTMFSEVVLPKLKTVFKSPDIYYLNINTVGIPESNLAEKIADFENNLPENFKLAYLPSFGKVRLRLTGYGKETEFLKAQARKLGDELYRIIPEYIYSEGNESLEAVIGQLLQEQVLSLSVAESFTGGRLSADIVSVAGASNYYQGGITAYTEEVKVKDLGVPQSIIDQYTVYSLKCAEAMAESCAAKFKTDCAISLTGVAGPQTHLDKAAGTVYIGLHFKGETTAYGYKFLRDRELNIQLGVTYALNLLRKKLKQHATI